MNKLKLYIKLLRVHQWVKNVFIFLPILFAFRMVSLDTIISLILAALGFSLVASSIYIINDWFDIEADKQHPEKCKRPLASGEVSKREGLWLFAIVFLLGFGIYFFIGKPFATILLAFYFVLNLAYSMKLKRYAIVDIVIVALGFDIRLFIGGIVAGAYLSHWIIIMTFLLALLLVVGKRKHDMTIFETTGKEMRKSIAGYNSEFINSIIIILVNMIVISYVMYTISPDVMARNGEYLYLSSLFVFIGLLRYLQVIFVKKKGDSPTKLIMTDRFLQLDILCWLVSFVGISITHIY